MCADAGDIYLGKYEGWYDVREETFVSDKDAEIAGFKDSYGHPLKRMSEESYFFRMSKYHKWLVEHIKSNPDFCLPAEKRNFLLSRLEEPLSDLSISRTTFEWGIPVPHGFDKKHVMYVWFDALSNYITGPRTFVEGDERSKYWPADVHVIGKDIIWFHCVIWPCMLKSAGLPVPKAVFSHGFISGKDGRKMSKSLGNVIDPNDLCDKYSSDTIRWYMARAAPYGSDMSFSEEGLVLMHNADLCDVVGNLVHRAFSLNEKYSGGRMPAPAAERPALFPPFDAASLVSAVDVAMSSFSLDSAFEATINAAKETNKFLADSAPWLLKGDDKAGEREEIVRVTIDAVYLLAHFIAPACPVAGTALMRMCGLPARPIPSLSLNFDNIPEGTTLERGKILFNKLVYSEEGGGSGAGGVEETKENGGTPAPKPQKGDANKSTKSSKKKQDGGGSNSSKSDGPDQDDFTKIDIRVGRITKVWKHPEAERLFCEEIECGEDEPRQVASGLREHYTLDEMNGRLLCVVCNLKPAKLAGFTSNGMVLASKDSASGKVELVKPPPRGCRRGKARSGRP